MADTAFSEDGKYFSSISQDGRLRIWDTETNVLKQEYTPDLHLTAPPSFLQWISTSQSAGSSVAKAWQQRTNQQPNQCIALGTKSGKILIYSVTKAKVESVYTGDENSKNQNNCIVSLDWHRKYGLYTCNTESIVHEWDLEKGAVRNKYNVNVTKNKSSHISAIKIIPHNHNTPARFLVTSSTQVQVWRLHHGDAELVKCLGHSATPKAILALACLNNVCWLLEGSQTERLLSFWDVTVTSDHMPLLNGDDTNTPNKKKRKKSTSAPIVVNTPTYNFVLEDAPKILDISAKEEEGGVQLSLAAATRSGVVHCYRHMLNGSSSKPIKPSVTIQVSSANAEPMPAVGCRIVGDDVLLGYTQRSQLIFERVTPDLKTKTQILIRGDDRKEGSKKNKEREKKKENQKEATKVRGEGGAGEVTYVEPMGGVSRKRLTVGAAVEAPMEQRLANLSVDVRARGRVAVSHNLTRLLVQALHSKDHKLIMSVIHKNKASVALQTVSALPADCVPALLDQLAEGAARNTVQCAAACVWVSAVLRCHAALLLAAAGGAHADHLARLLAIFTHRRSHLCQLLNLKGRLELTARHKTADDTREAQAVLQYNDTSSDSEMEVEKPSDSEGEQSWGEGAEDDDSGGSADE